MKKILLLGLLALSLVGRAATLYPVTAGQMANAGGVVSTNIATTSSLGFPGDADLYATGMISGTSISSKLQSFLNKATNGPIELLVDTKGNLIDKTVVVYSGTTIRGIGDSTYGSVGFIHQATNSGPMFTNVWNTNYSTHDVCFNNLVFNDNGGYQNAGRVYTFANLTNYYSAPVMLFGISNCVVQHCTFMDPEVFAFSWGGAVSCRFEWLYNYLRYQNSTLGSDAIHGPWGNARDIYIGHIKATGGDDQIALNFDDSSLWPTNPFFTPYSLCTNIIVEYVDCEPMVGANVTQPINIQDVVASSYISGLYISHIRARGAIQVIRNGPQKGDNIFLDDFDIGFANFPADFLTQPYISINNVNHGGISRFHFDWPSTAEISPPGTIFDLRTNTYFSISDCQITITNGAAGNGDIAIDATESSYLRVNNNTFSGFDGIIQYTAGAVNPKIQFSGNQTFGATNNFSGITNFVGDSAIRTIQTNFVSGLRYVNHYGSSIIVSASARDTWLVVSGILTNYTGATTNILSASVPAENSYWFTNAAGSPVLLEPGQLRITGAN